MLQAEFTTRTGIKVTSEEFESIHELYMSTDLEKDAFCEAYKTNNPLLYELAKQTRKAKELVLERKVILPSFVDSNWGECFRANWNLHDEYRDIDKVMCFLSGIPYENLNKLSEAGVKHKQEHPYGFDNKAVAEDFENLSLSKAISFVKVGDSSLHECAFFQFRCYKKGTLHLIFKDEALWARFNLAVNEGKMELGFSDK